MDRDQDLSSHGAMHASRVTEVLGHVCKREWGREKERARVRADERKTHLQLYIIVYTCIYV